MLPVPYRFKFKLEINFHCGTPHPFYDANQRIVPNPLVVIHVRS